MDNTFKLKIIDSKEEFVESLNLDRALSNAVTDILTNFEYKFESQEFNFKDYIGENIEILLNELENNIDLQKINEFVEGVLSNNTSLVFEKDTINAMCQALESIAKLPLLEELFPYAEFLDAGLGRRLSPCRHGVGSRSFYVDVSG